MLNPAIFWQREQPAAAYPEARYAIVWERGQLARQPAPKYDMRLFGSAGSLPAVGHALNLHV